MCVVGRPRRVAELSITSSCTSAEACSNSSAENNSSISASASLLDIARQPQ
jgi:hypothetical protein